MPVLDFDLLAEHAQQYLDLDSRFWDQAEGCFEFDGVAVFYERLEDHFILSVQQIEITVPRP